MMTHVQIQGLQTYGYHGLFDEERRLGQKFSFDIRAALAPCHSHDADDLAGSVRYDAVVEEAVRLAGAEWFQTLEPLAEAMATGLLTRFALMDTVAVDVPSSARRSHTSSPRWASA